MTPTDALRELQRLAAIVAALLSPGKPAVALTLVDVTGQTIIAIPVPIVVAEDDMRRRKREEDEPPTFAAGWSFTEKLVLFDGKVVAVAGSRLKLLRVLVDADGKLTAKELAKMAFGVAADEENSRYHVKALRAELAIAFPDFEAEIIPGDGGYRLVLR